MGPLSALGGGGLFFALYLCPHVGRALAIDFGLKRCGLAVSDPLRISMRELGAVPTSELLSTVLGFMAEEEVTTVVIGEPGKPDAEFVTRRTEFLDQLKEQYPRLEIALQDEDYSSQRASRYLVDMGIPQKKRRQKETLDAASALVILSDFLEEKQL